MIDPSRKVRPPGGVRFAGWMIGIGAFFLCLAGVLLLLVHPDQATLDEASMTQGILQLIGFIVLAIGLLEFLLIYALWDGSNTARIIATILIGLSVLGSLAQVLARSPGAALAFIQLLIGIVILIGLWGTPNATEFFNRPEATAPMAPPSTPPPPPPPPL